MLSIRYNRRIESYKEIKKDPQKKTKVILFINKCNWERINYPSKKKKKRKNKERNDWKKLEKKCLCFET